MGGATALSGGLAAVEAVSLLRASAEAGPDGLLVVAPDGRMVLANRRFAEIWGFPAELVERADHEAALEAAMERVADRERFLADVRACYADPVAPCRHEVTLADGRVLDRYGAPLRERDGTYVGWAWYFRDITADVRARRDLQRLADTLQASLLPPRPPQIPGMQVATRYVPSAGGVTVGGDFYDVFRLRSNAWGLVVGDVCGKGPEAAALTSLVRYSLRAAALHHDEPAKVLADLNEALLEDPSMGERFATVVYAKLEQDTCGAWVTLACGGHPLPIMVRRAGWIDVRGQAGTLLGLFDDIDVADDRVGLGPGDALVFFTDGISEARPDGGELFEAEGLPATLLACAHDACDAEEIADRVVAAARDHSGGDPLHDDVAVLVVRVPPDAADDPEGRLRAALGGDPSGDLPGYPVGKPEWGGSRRPGPPREARLQLRAEPAAVPAARRFVAGVLHSWRMSELTGGDAELLTSEVVTNAVRHGRSPFSVIIRYDGDSLRVEVGDGSRAVPRMREPTAEATGGRGVYLVGALAVRWGVQPTLDGKRVWFELPAPEPPRRAEPPA